MNDLHHVDLFNTKLLFSPQGQYYPFEGHLQVCYHPGLWSIGLQLGGQTHAEILIGHDLSPCPISILDHGFHNIRGIDCMKKFVMTFTEITYSSNTMVLFLLPGCQILVGGVLLLPPLSILSVCPVISLFSVKYLP